ncbi:MAG TPA: HD domain-containing phosphohydrolase [Gemmatimonadaceae bacterium]|nr:HD domain-containing phosphohydrolase [Gemmatimonadaceae bacterium]
MVLIVDDEESIRRALARFLLTRGFDVRVAASGAEALELLRSDRFHIMICDVRMPVMNGIEVATQALVIDSDMAIVMLSAVNDAPTAIEALACGATDYLIKPMDLADLHLAMRRALQKREQRLERQGVEQLIRDQVSVRTAELEREKLAMRDMSVSIAETLINAMEAKDVYLRGHSQRVADLGAEIAADLDLPPDIIEAVHLAGRLHDVGKIGIREEVLNKPARLTEEEFAHIKDHVRIGMEILAPLRHLGIVLEFVHDHHEHIDGTGYPRGRSGESISIGGRILTAADAFDAVTSKRAYREPMTTNEALELFGRDVGSFLDTAVYAALQRVVGLRIVRSA